LRKALDAVKAADYAIDDEEVFEGLRCSAVPVRDRHGKTVAAISMSRTVNFEKPIEESTLLTRLRDCAARIAKSL
jgi:DNA-binding IclR family transcriptional regulator